MTVRSQCRYNNLMNKEITDSPNKQKQSPSYSLIHLANEMNPNKQKTSEGKNPSYQKSYHTKQNDNKIETVPAKFTLEHLAARNGTFRVTAEVLKTGVEYFGKITIPNNGSVVLEDFEKRFQSMATLQLNNDESAHLHYVIGQTRLWTKKDSSRRPLFALVRVYSGRKAITLMETSGCRQMGNELFVTLAQRKPRKFCIQQLGGRAASTVVSVIQTGPDWKEIAVTENQGIHNENTDGASAEEVYSCTASDIGSKDIQIVELQPFQRFRFKHIGSGPPSIILVSAIPNSDE